MNRVIRVSEEEQKRFLRILTELAGVNKDLVNPDPDIQREAVERYKKLDDSLKALVKSGRRGKRNK